MTSKNKKLTKAAWLGMLIEFWSFVDRVSKKTNNAATRRLSNHTRRQDALLADITSVKVQSIEKA